jgi:hypothetical protein
VRNTESYERSVIASLATKITTSDEGFGCGLVGPQVALGDGAQIADCVATPGFHVSVGDFVARGRAVGSVSACCSHWGQLVVFVDVHIPLRDASAHTAEYTSAGRLAVWHTAELQLCLAWRRLDDGSMLVIRR